MEVQGTLASMAGFGMHWKAEYRKAVKVVKDLEPGWVPFPVGAVTPDPVLVEELKLLSAQYEMTSPETPQTSQSLN